MHDGFFILLVGFGFGFIGGGALGILSGMMLCLRALERIKEEEMRLGIGMNELWLETEDYVWLN